MTEKQPAKPRANDVNIGELDRLRQEAKREYQASRRYAVAALGCGAVMGTGLIYAFLAPFEYHSFAPTVWACGADLAATIGMASTTIAASSRGSRARALDDAIFGALSNMQAKEEPSVQAGPGAFELESGHTVTQSVAITSAHLREILATQGVDLIALQQIAPAQPVLPAEESPLPNQE